MTSVKKVLNDPKDAVPEMLEGLVEASGGRIRKLENYNVVVKASLSAGKVGLLIGGGSGHEPLFPGFVGNHLADGAACGNIFAAPSPETILEATRALSQGRGVLYVYGNYAGDNMNFDIAAEMASDEGIDTRTVRVWDDVASAPPESMDERRGIAGDLFVIKVAGGVAATCFDLDEVERVTRRARDWTRSMGVALAAGSHPETGELTFQLPDDEIELGMGLHGERGVWRAKMLPADQLVTAMLERLLADLPFKHGDRVCLLINDLGATTQMELLIVSRKAHQILREHGIAVHDTVVGSFCTCQEMTGFSISLMKLDDELQQYYDLPASGLGFAKA